MINKDALEKVKTAKMKGESFATILEDLNLTLEVTGAAETSITFDYQHDDLARPLLKICDLISLLQFVFLCHCLSLFLSINHRYLFFFKFHF